jgi:hypothetical protein
MFSRFQRCTSWNKEIVEQTTSNPCSASIRQSLPFRIAAARRFSAL